MPPVRPVCITVAEVPADSSVPPAKELFSAGRVPDGVVKYPVVFHTITTWLPDGLSCTWRLTWRELAAPAVKASGLITAVVMPLNSSAPTSGTLPRVLPSKSSVIAGEVTAIPPFSQSVGMAAFT